MYWIRKDAQTSSAGSPFWLPYPSSFLDMAHSCPFEKPGEEAQGLVVYKGLFWFSILFFPMRALLENFTYPEITRTHCGLQTYCFQSCHWDNWHTPWSTDFLLKQINCPLFFHLGVFRLHCSTFTVKMGSEARDSHNYILTCKGKLKHCGVLLAGHWKEVWCHFSNIISEDASNDISENNYAVFKSPRRSRPHLEGKKSFLVQWWTAASFRKKGCRPHQIS